MEEDDLDLLQVLGVLAVLLEGGETGFHALLKRILAGETLELKLPKTLLSQMPSDLQARATFFAADGSYVLRVTRTMHPTAPGGDS